MEQNTSALIKRAASGDLAARDELFQKNIGLVYSVARKFSNRGVEFDDLVQIGSIGLVKAIDKFDESFGVMLSTYAVPLISGEIKRFLRDNGPIKASRVYREISLKAGYVRDELIKKEGREPTIAEIADILNVDKSELAAAFEATQIPESIYATCGDSDKELLVDKISGGLDSESGIIDRLSLECDTFTSEKLVH